MTTASLPNFFAPEISINSTGLPSKKYPQSPGAMPGKTLNTKFAAFFQGVADIFWQTSEQIITNVGAAKKFRNDGATINRTILVCFIFFIAFLTSCEQTPTPKPTAYPNIYFPKKEYKTYDSSCPFTFRFPVYARVVHDSSKDADPCWLNINYTQFNAKLHLSYKAISSFKNFHEFSEDAHTFAYKHSVKADDITPNYFRFSKNVTGILYEIEGNTASSIQFYVTDSVEHYLRGALYFNNRPNKDSLGPVIQYLRTDIDTFLKSLKWK